MPGLTRALFLIVAATAMAVLIGSAACTRRGGGGVPPVITPTPITTYYVDPVKGSDKNPGTQTMPFKTLTHALTRITVSGLTISLKAGTYSVRSGEKFPIAIPTGVVVAGNNYGHSFAKGTFLNGYGEDTKLETLLKAPPHTLYATVVVEQGATSVSLDGLYVGTTAAAGGAYAAVDSLGAVSATQDTFGSPAHSANAGGVLLPSGTFSCTGCFITGPSYAIKAFTLAGASSPPTVRLNGPGRSVIGGGDGLLTDGTATISAASQVFQSTDKAYTDSLALATATPSPRPEATSTASPSPSPSGSPIYSTGTVDFGYGSNGSLGGNTFAGSRIEIEVTTSGSTVSALNNSWNQNTQGTNPAGQYARARTFLPGTTGRNVTISGTITGARVFAGPAPAPTPTPSPTPYGSPTASPSPAPT